MDGESDSDQLSENEKEYKRRLELQRRCLQRKYHEDKANIEEIIPVKPV